VRQHSIGKGPGPPASSGYIRFKMRVAIFINNFSIFSTYQQFQHLQTISAFFFKYCTYICCSQRYVLITRQNFSAYPIFLLFSNIVRVCFKAVIQSLKKPEHALFSLKNHNHPALGDLPPDPSYLWWYYSHRAVSRGLVHLLKCFNAPWTVRAPPGT